MELTKKPSRKDLLRVITELQGMIGNALGLHWNDRDPQGHENGQRLLQEAHDLCIRARSFDPPGE